MEYDSLEKCEVVSPTTFKATVSLVDGLFCLGALSSFRQVSVDALIILPVAPESIVKRMWVLIEDVQIR